MCYSSTKINFTPTYAMTMVRRREKSRNMVRPASIGTLLLSGAIGIHGTMMAAPVVGEEPSGNARMTRRRLELPKAPLNEIVDSEKDMQRIWEKASRVAKNEIDSMRLLQFSPDMSMGSPSGDGGPSRPPATVPTAPPNTGPTQTPEDCLMGRTKEEYFLDVLGSVTEEDVLNDLSTPQGTAFDYLVNDDPALDDPCASNTLEQRYGLTTLYFATQGAEWNENSGWLGAEQECSWAGVECESGSEIVTLLLLPSNNLVGGLPDELQTLAQLQRFDIFSNAVTGTIPSGLSSMTDLVLLDLEENLMTGSAFPETLFDLTSLIAYRVSNNFLSGTITRQIGDMQNLEQLWVATNQITGSLPTQIAAASKLQSIFLYENILEGSLPAELGQLSDLSDLRLQSNTLQENIPVELFQATNLEVLRLDVNFFSETIPAEVGNLVNLRDFRVNTNSLSGVLPSEIGQLTALENLIVNNNFFSGQIPNVFENLVQLDFLDASNANFFGTIPESIFSVPTLRILYLSNNTLTGTIPSTYSSPPLLRDLFLDGNGFTGTVPEIASGELQELNEFLVQFNFLTGSMPSSVCALRSVELDDLFSDCGGSNPEIECEFPGCCNRCFEGGDAAQRKR